MILPVDWSSDDPAIATSDGNAILPVSAGLVRIVARISSGATVAMTLRAASRTSDVLYSETWDMGWDTRWQMFGTPLPLAVDREMGRALLVNGDGEFGSGVKRNIPYSPGDGLAVEALVSTPVHRAWWQQLNFEMLPQSVQDTLAAQSHCGIQVPAGATEAQGGFDDEFLFSEPGLLSGSPWRVRIQILPDGGCAVAINGKARFRSWPMKWGADSIIIRIGGQSVGTEMLSGPVTIWRGIPPGVDWNTVSPSWEARPE